MMVKSNPVADAVTASPDGAIETISEEIGSMSEEIRSMTEEIQPMEVDKSWSF